MGVSMRHMRLCLLAGLAMFWALTGARGGEDALPPMDAALPSAQIPAQRIDLLVRQLTAPQFLTRELAMQELMTGGGEVIPPLLAAIPQGDLELSVRGMVVLRELAVGNDPVAAEAAYDALDRLSAAAATPAGRRALSTLAMLDDLRQSRAVTELRQLGADLRLEDTVLVGLGPQRIITEVTTLALGPEYRGGTAGLVHLKWIKGVNRVVLHGEQVTDAWLLALRHMPQLEYIEIKRARVTDAGLAPLGQLERLRHLAVMYTPVSNRALEHLQRLPALVELKLYGTEITIEAAEQLQEKLTGAGVDFKRGAFVGVGCNALGPVCQVTQVQPNSAALRADVRVGDVIVSYGGERVTDFESLRTLIQKHKAGERVKMEVERDGQTLEKELLLGEWE